MSEENKELIIEEVEIKGKKRKINLEKYAKFFSDKDFFEKLRKFAKKVWYQGSLHMPIAILHFKKGYNP
ncbi:hypothetical protein R2R32_05515 [Clostridium perfringens]|nr:hypothetical protein [Clostridium perfringens]